MVSIQTLTGLLANIEAIPETTENFRERRAAIAAAKVILAHHEDTK